MQEMMFYFSGKRYMVIFVSAAIVISFFFESIYYMSKQSFRDLKEIRL